MNKHKQNLSQSINFGKFSNMVFDVNISVT